MKTPNKKLSGFLFLNIFTYSLLFLAACGGAEKEVSTGQDGLPVSGIDLNNMPLADVNESQYVEHAYLYLEHNKSIYNLYEPRSQLEFKNEKIDNLQKKHVKFQQVHKGIPVWGREIIAHLDENNFIYSINGEVLPDIRILDTQPAITVEEAAKLLMQADQWGGNGWRVKDVELYIFNINSNNYLAYRLTLTKGLLRELLFMNAHDGEVIHQISGTHTKD